MMKIIKLFIEELSYGEHMIEYGVDEKGTPVAIHRYYKPRQIGPVMLEPGPLEKEEVFRITFADIRKAAERTNKLAYLDINESNWKKKINRA